MMLNKFRKYLLVSFLFFSLPILSYGKVVVDSSNQITIEGENIEIPFRVFSSEYIQPGVNYEITVRNNEKEIIVFKDFFKKDITIYPENTIEDNIVLKKYNFPQGNYDVFLSIINGLNNNLGEYPIGNFSIGEGNDILIENCLFKLNEESFPINSKEILLNKENQEIKISCEVYNLTDNIPGVEKMSPDETINFNISLFDFNKKEQIFNIVRPIEIPPFSLVGEKTSVSFNLPVKDTGEYELFFNAKKELEPNIIYSFVSKIKYEETLNTKILKNVYFDNPFQNNQISGYIDIDKTEDYYNSLSSENGFQLGSLYFDIKVFDRENNSCETDRAPIFLDKSKDFKTLHFKLALNNDCKTDRLVFEVLDNDANILDSYIFKITNTEKTIEQKTNILPYIFLSLLIIIFILVFVLIKKNDEIK